MSLISGYSKAGEKIGALFSESSDILHNASKGAVREFIVKEIIRPFLPKRFGLATGECFDRDYNKSKQLDCIIYDEMYSYRIPFGDAYSIFPCEAVYGNIEVKSELNKSSFEEAIKNIASLKGLQRDITNEYDITPNVRITVNGNSQSNIKKNAYFGVTFAFNSCKSDTILAHIQQSEMDTKLLPNMIVLYNEKTIILPVHDKHVELGDGSITGFTSFDLGDNINAMFIALLITVLDDINLRINPKEIKKYVLDTLLDESIPKRRIEHSRP